LNQQFSIIAREISTYSSKTVVKITSKPESLIPWTRFIDTLLLSVGLESMVLLNKWDIRFSSWKGLKELSLVSRKSNLYDTITLALLQGKAMQVNKPEITQNQVFVFYRVVMELYPELERKLYAFIMQTVDDDLHHITNKFFNFNDSLHLYCNIAQYHIRSTAIGLQEREEKIHSDPSFLIHDPSHDPGIVAAKLNKEIELINKLSAGTMEITERTKCVLFRKAINNTPLGRKLYATTFNSLDDKKSSGNFIKLKQAIQDTYRDFVIPTLKQKKSGNAYKASTDSDFSRSNDEHNDDELANPANHRNGQKKKLNNDGIEYGLCFDFMKTGKCDRGSTCRYEHADRKNMVKSMFANMDILPSFEADHDDEWDYIPDTSDHYDYTSETPGDESGNYANRQRSRNFRPRRGGKGGNRGRSFGNRSKGGKGKGKSRRPYQNNFQNGKGKGGKGRRFSRNSQPRRPGLNWQNTTSANSTVFDRLSELANDGNFPPNDQYSEHQEYHDYANYAYNDYQSSYNDYDDWTDYSWYYDEDEY
jgi:hypothetical protein